MALAASERLEERLALAIDVLTYPFGAGVTSGTSHYAVLLMNDGDSGFLKRNDFGTFTFANNSQFLDGGANTARPLFELLPTLGNLSTIYVTGGESTSYTGSSITRSGSTSMTYSGVATPGSNGVIPGTFSGTVTVTSPLPDGTSTVASALLLASPDATNRNPQFFNDLRFERTSGDGPLPTAGGLDGSFINLTTGSVTLRFAEAPISVTFTPFDWAIYDAGPDPLSFTLSPGQTPNQRFLVDLGRVPESSTSIDSPLAAALGDATEGFFAQFGGYAAGGQVVFHADNVTTNANVSTVSRFSINSGNAIINRPVAAVAHTVDVIGKAGDPGSFVLSEQGALANSLVSPMTSQSGALLFNAFQSDVTFAGVVNAGSQTYLFQSPADDPRGYTWTTKSPTSGVQTGTLAGSIVIATLANSAGGDVNLRTALDTLRFTASSTPSNPVLPYTFDIDETDDLLIDAVPASGRPISIRTGGTLTLDAAIQTTCDLSLVAKNQLTISAPISAATGTVSLVADALTVAGSITAGAMRAVSLESLADDGNLAINSLVRSGGTVKAPVRAATTGHVVLLGLQTIDGVALVAGDRVLVKNQASAATNGIYVVAAGAWTRASDANVSSMLAPGFVVSVLEGSQEGNWTFANALTPTLNQTALFFVPASATQAFLPVRAATTGSVSLSGAQSIDGIALVAGDRVLVKDQANARQNGIYVVAAGAWERASDANTPADLRAGSYVFVAEGAANGTKGFMLDTDAIQVGITPLTFSPFTVQATRTNPFTPANVLQSVAAATTTDVVLADAQSIDGIDVIVGDRVLVKNQRVPAENGVYVVAAGAWSRATDADTSAGLARGTTVWVDGGINNGGTSWLVDDTVVALGAVAAGNSFVTGLASTAALVPGMLVTGAGIPTGTTIAQVVGPTSIRLSFAATLDEPEASLAFTRTTAVAVGTEPIFFLPSGGIITATGGQSISSGAAITSRLQGAIGLLTAGAPVGGLPDGFDSIAANTNFGRLFATAPADIEIANTGAIDLFDVRTTTGGGVTVTAGGTLSALSVSAAGTIASPAGVNLKSTSGDLVAAAVTTVAGDIALSTSSGDVIVTKLGPFAGNVNAQNGQVSLSANRTPGATGGDILINGRVVADGVGSDVVLTTNDGLVTFTGAVTVTAADQLRIFSPAQTPQVAAAAQGKITAGRLSLEAPFGASTSYPAGLGTYQVLNVNRTDDGAIDITSPASLSIEGASTTNGSISFAAPTVTVSGTVRPGGAGAAISLTASAGNLNIDATLDSPTTITLAAPAGQIGNSAGASTPLITAVGTLLVRAATKASLLTKVNSLDAELTADGAALTVVEADGLLIQSVKLASGGVVDVTVGTPALGGSATVTLLDASPTGTAKITSQESILATIDGVADIRGGRAELAATTGRIEVETSVDVLVASAQQKNQSMKITDLGTGATPLVLESVAGGSGADVTITSQRTLDAVLVKTTGKVSLQTLATGADILVGTVEATGNTVTLSATGGIRERTPSDPEADIVATTVALSATSGSIDVHVDASALSAVAVAPTAVIRVRDENDLSIGDGAVGLSGGNVTLEIGGTLSQTKAVTATKLVVGPTVAGASVGVTLENAANSVGTVALLGGTKAVSFVNAAGVMIDALSGGSVSLRAAGAITQGATPTAPITATTLSVTATAAGDVALTNATNNVATLSGSTAAGSFTYVDADGFTVGAPGVVVGTAASGDGDIALTAKTGDLGIAGSLTATNDRITLAAPGGTITQSAGTITANVFEWTALTPPTFTSLAINVLGPNLTGPGNLEIGAAGQPLTVASASTADGNITIVGSNVTIDGLVSAGGAGKAVAVDASGAILFQNGGRIVNADTAGSVSLNAGTTITATNGAAQTTVTTGGGLAVTAGGATGLKTDVGSLSATVAAGGLTIDDVGSLQVAGITAAGQAVSLAAAGGITQTGRIVANGLTATSTTGGVVLADVLNSVATVSGSTGSGDFVFVDADGFTVVAPGITAGAVGSGNGSIDLTAVTGNLVIAGNPSQANLTALDDTVALRAPNGQVDQRAGSVITAGTLVWEAQSATLQPGNQIGAIGVKLTAVGSVRIPSIGTFAGTLRIAEVTTVDGAIEIVADDVVIVGPVLAGGAANTVIVTAANGGIAFVENGRVVAQGAVTLGATAAITSTTLGPIVNVTTPAALLATAGTGVIDLDTAIGSVSATAAGAILLTEVDGVAVAGVSSTGGTVTITAGGSISNGGAGTDLTAASAILSAGGGIDLDLAVGTITATATDNVVFSETDGITVAGVSSSVGSVTITAGGPITGGVTGVDLTAAVAALTAGTGSIDLDLAVGSVSAAAPGNVTLTDTDGVTLTDVRSTTGNVTVTTVAGDIAVATGAAPAGTVTLTAAGGITDTDGDVDVTAISAVLTAVTGGISADLAVGSVTATAPGAIDLSDVDAITLSSVVSTAGNVGVTAGGAMTATSVAASAGNVSLVTTAGNIAVGVVTASTKTGRATITAAGSITDGDPGIDVTASAATLNAGTGGIDLDLAVGSVGGTAAGAIGLSNSGSISLAGLASTAGSIAVAVASGNINVAGVTANAAGGVVTLDVPAGTITQSGPLAAAVVNVIAPTSAAVSLTDPGNAVSKLVTSIGGAALSMTNTVPLSIVADAALSVGRVVTQGNLAVTTPGDLLLGPVTAPFPVLQSTTQLDLRQVQGTVTLVNGGQLVAPSVLLNPSNPLIDVGGSVNTTAGLNQAVAAINSLPQIAGAIYQITVGANLTLSQPLVFNRAVAMSGPGFTLAGSAGAADGVVLNSGASGSRLTNLAFAGFSGSAVTLNAAQNVTVSGITVSDSGTGIKLTGNLDGTTIQGTTLTGNAFGMQLVGAQRATIGGRSVAERNTIAGASRAGVFASGFCTRTTITGTVFTALPRTRTQFNIRSSRNLRVSGTIVEKPPRPAATVASGRSPIRLFGR
jgi:fibronectin-binding autotransporter adhesin